MTLASLRAERQQVIADAAKQKAAFDQDRADGFQAGRRWAIEQASYKQLAAFCEQRADHCAELLAWVSRSLGGQTERSPHWDFGYREGAKSVYAEL